MRSRTIAVLAAAIATGACASLPAGSGGSASAAMRTATGADAGTLRLDATSGGVRLTGVLTGLAPGAHGIHFHAVGRCEGADFTSAGGHFNPAGRRHGLMNPDGPHAGDLPAIAADQNGRAAVDVTTARITLDDAPGTGVLDADGTAIVVHAANDDQRTDPAGNAGARVLCGLVARAAAP